jgi:anti-sigma factor RsiW
MEHNRAVESQAVDRYLLGEMPADEREDFEEHYFTCAQCAQDVCDAARFRANAREVLRDLSPYAPLETTRRSTWRNPFTIFLFAAASLLLAVVTYQNLVTIPALRVPLFPSTLILDGLTRGAVPHIDEGKPVDLRMAPEAAAEGQTMAVELVGPSGKITRSPVIVPERDQSLHISFPGKFPVGAYDVYVREVPSGRLLFRDHIEISPKENRVNER